MKKLILLFSIPAIAALLAASCTTDGIDTASPVVSSDGNIINVAGVYRNEESSPIVSPTNSGLPVIQIDLRQNGSSLEGIDNNGKIFRGTLGRASEGNKASFNMTGQTTAGKEVTISGTIRVESGIGKMNGTWIEPDFYATIAAIAIGPSSFTNQPPSLLTITSSSGSFTINTNGGKLTLTVSGGTGPYTWRRSEPSRGDLNTTTGSTVEYTRTTSSAGLNNTVTVEDSTGAEKSQQITQP
jgi:hypothetical protein